LICLLGSIKQIKMEPNKQIKLVQSFLQSDNHDIEAIGTMNT
jgi:hypothetical protein